MIDLDVVPKDQLHDFIHHFSHSAKSRHNLSILLKEVEGISFRCSEYMPIDNTTLKAKEECFCFNNIVGSIVEEKNDGHNKAFF